MMAGREEARNEVLASLFIFAFLLILLSVWLNQDFVFKNVLILSNYVRKYMHDVRNGKTSNL
jgi:hypothetical protein